VRRALAAAVLVAATAAAAPPSFKGQIVPLLRDRCVGCHLTGDEVGGMALHAGAAYKTTVGVPSLESPLVRIRPGKPDESYLVAKIEGRQAEVGGAGARMPLEAAPLSSEEIALIRAWIEAGAPDN
jgi:hypothetical protein